MTNPTIEVLLSRRSVKADDMSGPDITPEQLDMILRAGHRVPDHGKIGPWRFVVFQGDGRSRFGHILKTAYLADHPEATDEDLIREATRFERAPVVVAVISSPKADHPKVPVFEQLLSVGAACQNMLVAAQAQGLAGQWLTEWPAESEHVREALDLEMDDLVAGFLYFGHAEHTPDDRARPDFNSVVRWY